MANADAYGALGVRLRLVGGRLPYGARLPRDLLVAGKSVWFTWDDGWSREALDFVVEVELTDGQRSFGVQRVRVRSAGSWSSPLGAIGVFFAFIGWLVLRRRRVGDG